MKDYLIYTTNNLNRENLHGGPRRLMEIVKGLADKGSNVTLVAADVPDKIKYDKNINFIKMTIKKSNLLPHEVAMFIGNVKLLFKLKKRQFDSIIVFDVPQAIHLSLLNFKNINLFLRQDLIEYRRIVGENENRNIFTLNLYLLVLRTIESLCFLKANRIIVQCEHDLISICKRHSLIRKEIKKKTKILINNINTSWNTKEFFEEDTRIIDGKIKIAFIGNFSDERKGQSLVIPAMMNLLRKGYNFEFNVVGAGKHLERYKKLSKNYPQINYLGFQSSVKDIICDSDFTIVPSLIDSCPNTVLESLYYEVPVYATNTGGIPDILVENEYMFEPNQNSLEEKIQDVLDNKKYLSDKFRQKTIAKRLNFDWVSEVEKIISS